MRAQATHVTMLCSLLACQPAAPQSDSTTDASVVHHEPYPLAAEPQRAGDPARGRDVVLNEDYVTCGVPYSAYARAYGPAPASERLPGRNALNSAMPYYNTRFIHRESGVDLVTANCLFCHAGTLRGELIVGLGNSTLDFTFDRSSTAELAGALITDETERTEWRKWADRLQATNPYLVTRTIGVNPADSLAAILFSHREQATLTWSDRPLMETPPLEPIPTDVPAWWHMKKKHTMFYAGNGRGDHARIMMSASALCTDTLDEAQRIDGHFADVRAFIASLEAPPWPGTVNQDQAARGEEVFTMHCSRCHGTYGDEEIYPNLLVPQHIVGTDPMLVASTGLAGERFVEWFNGSFYGEIARFEPTDGYVAPPLDGIWATAPYLHNGSVPTLTALLNSAERPTWWTRSFNTSDYDEVAVGWEYTELDHGQADEPDASLRVRIYDTTLAGYSNAGHTFGDVLSPDERADLIEYLKTL